ncbi:hypothetical protein ACIG63_45705 [Streptomyces antimycoticus]|uniref:hypothetical protein n=1 Tax=Streptomyces antimycoticus TaxID=68175 RepID=UPI0037D09DF8
MVSGTPAWALSLIVGAVLLVLVGVAYLTARTLWRAAERKRQRLAEESKAAVEAGKKPDSGRAKLPKRLYVMALCSMSVSLYGMWGFARETAQLPQPFAVGFVSAFDVTELVLFTLLYKRAENGWTTQLRFMHNLAWTLVGVSATANWIHAPNAASKPFMAIMPVVAALVIELEFRAVMKGAEVLDTEARPGPIKLIGLLWTKGWSAVFAGLDIDPASKGGQIYRAALAKKAGKKLFRLRTLLDAHTKLIASKEAKRRRLTAAVKELEQARKASTTAMDRADFAVDSSQALAVLRSLGGWTEVDDVATVDFKKPLEVTELMERVAIMPAAKQIEAAGRAAEAEEERRRAEEAREEALAARQRAEDEKRAALEEKQRAEAARAEAEEELRQAKIEAENARQNAERAAEARKEAEAARQRAEEEKSDSSRSAEELTEKARRAHDRLAEARRELENVQFQIANVGQQREDAATEAGELRRELEHLRGERERAQDLAETAEEEARTVRGRINDLQRALDALSEQYRKSVADAQKAADLREEAEAAQREAAEEVRRTRAEAQEAAELLKSLRPQLAERVAGAPETPVAADGPAFKSEAKQSGWEHYLAEVTAGREAPTAAKLVEKFKINDGNARNWIIEFRSKRAEMIAVGAAREARGGEDGFDGGHAVPRAARDEPRASRAGGHVAAEEAARLSEMGEQRLSA